MFILEFINLKENHEVDVAREQQGAYLNRYMSCGTFLVAGSKVPRTGGIIIAQGVSRAAIEEIVAAAPFVLHGFTRVVITEFKAIFVAAGLALAPMEVGKSREESSAGDGH